MCMLPVELVDGSSYLGQPLLFPLNTLIWIEVLVIGYVELQRSSDKLDPEKSLYPAGNFFDPLSLAVDPENKATLQLEEIKHAPQAMVAILGFAVQAAATEGRVPSTSGPPTPATRSTQPSSIYTFSSSSSSSSS